MNKIIRIAFAILVLFGSLGSLQAQDILKGKDLSQVKVDQMSDADVEKLAAQLTANNTSIDQAEQIALSKGMPAMEFAKLKARLNAKLASPTGKLKTAENTATVDKKNNSTDQYDSASYATKSKPLIDSLIFGSELYTSIAPSFEPNLKLATPVNYILGPDDQLQITVYGVQEYSGDLLVSSEGTINIPNVGQIKVAGLSIEAATQKIKTQMGNTVYPYLRSGGSKLSVTLSKIRSIKVIIIGANRPGTFTLSSLATVFNALFISGGPSQFGSFRQIELIRNNKVIDTIDLYRFLLNGDQRDNVGLKDNDVIRIPPYKSRVELQGQVKRAGIFEVLPGEHFADILQFASGFTDTAYKGAVKVYQRTDLERRLHDLPSSAFNSYVPQSGDLFVASKIVNRYTNRVRITGAVYRPDVYELSEGLKVADLIRRAEGLKEGAFTGRGQILRLEDDLTRSILSFDVAKALADNKENNVLLKREDEVLISFVQDLKDSLTVNIQGEVRRPGNYDYVDKLTLKDLVLQAGGLTDAAFKRVEVARMLRRDTTIAPTDFRASEVINMEINDLNAAAANIYLQPFDVVTIRKKVGYTAPESVTVVGQVQYPGPYALISTTERASDVLRRAGGFTPDANADGAYVKRFKTATEKAKAEEVAKKAQKNMTDSMVSNEIVNDITRNYDQIALDMDAVLNHPGSAGDFILRAGDEIVIPKFDAQVKISGAVLMTTQVTYRKNASLTDYISDAGGFGVNAIKRKSYVVYANGRASSTKSFLFFKFYPKVLPGSEIVVPKKADKKALGTGEIIGLASALASLAGVVIAVLNMK